MVKRMWKMRRGGGIIKVTEKSVDYGAKIRQNEENTSVLTNLSKASRVRRQEAPG